MSPVAALAVTLFGLAFLLACAVRRVPEGSVYTVHRFGHFVRALPPGLHLVWPFVDRIAHQVPLIGHHVELPLRQLGQAEARADLYYQILDPVRAGDTLDEVDDWVARQAGAVLSEVAEDATAAPASLLALADTLKVELNRRLGGTGLRIIRCSLV